MKCEKLLADAGLIDSSSTQQRRHSMDDLDGKTTSITSTVAPPANIDYAKSVRELEEIILNQKKYIQQLQLRIRITTSDSRPSSTSDNTAEHIQVDQCSMPLSINLTRLPLASEFSYS